MPHIIGIEELPGRHPVAWLLELPGCAVEVEPGTDLFACVAERETEYFAWREGFHGGFPLPSGDDALPTLSKPVQPAGDGFCRAFFREDTVPLSADDAFELGWLLELSHRELCGVVQLMSAELLGDDPLPEPWRTRKTELMHLVKRECHLLDGTVEFSVRTPLPASPLDAMILVRGYTMNQLSNLVAKPAQTAADGEQFSARKMARLLIHHDLAATRHLRVEAARG